MDKARWLKENTLAPTPPTPCRFKVGDKVLFTNSYGIKFGPHIVLGFAGPDDVLTKYGKFIHIDVDSVWCPVAEESLTIWDDGMLPGVG